jgi:hypothetical protein
MKEPYQLFRRNNKSWYVRFRDDSSADGRTRPFLAEERNPQAMPGVRQEVLPEQIW